MKKTYILPNVRVVEATTEEFFATSPGTPNAAIDPETNVDAGSIESRRKSVWDDEE